MNRFLAACLAYLLAITPAFAAWSVTQKATAQNSAQHSLGSGNITISSGDLIVVLGEMRKAVAGDTINVTDAVGNTYTVIDPNKSGIGTCTSSVSSPFIAWAKATTGLTAQAITVADDVSATATAITFSVIDVTGYDTTTVEDTAARNCNTGTATTTPTVISGTPTYSGNLFVSVWGVGSSASGASFTAGGSWIPSAGYGTGNTNILELADWLDATGSSSTQTNNPTTNSKAYAMPITAFKASGSVAATSCTLGLMGVGAC